MLRKRNLRTGVVAALLALATGSAYAQQDSSAADKPVLVGKSTAQGVMISGTVSDAVTHKGIGGIRVKVDDFSATLTDSVGNFSLKVPSYSSTVSVEGEGY